MRRNGNLIAWAKERGLFVRDGWTAAALHHRRGTDTPAVEEIRT